MREETTEFAEKYNTENTEKYKVIPGYSPRTLWAVSSAVPSAVSAVKVLFSK